MPRPLRTAALACSALLGLGIAGFAATPAFAATVTSTEELNAAIAMSDPQITIGADFTLTADIAAIGYDVEIIGGGHTIDADGHVGFFFSGSATVSALTVTRFAGRAYDAQLDDGERLTLLGANASAGGTGVGVRLNGTGSSLSVSGGSFTGLTSYGVYFDDYSGAVAVDIDDAEFEAVRTAIHVSQLTGGSTLEVSGARITDTYEGIRVNFATGTAAAVISDTSITAGPRYAGETGVHGYLTDAASLVLADSSVTSVPGVEGFAHGVDTYLWADSSVAITDSALHANAYNVLVSGFAPGVSHTILRSTLTDAQYYGVFYNQMAGRALIDQTTIDGGGRDGAYSGAEVHTRGEFTLSRSTVSNNSRGGIVLDLADGAEAAIVNSTVSGNGGVGAAAVQVGGTGGGEALWLRNSTVTANTLWAGVSTNNVIAAIQNSVVSGNTIDAGGADLVAADSSEAYVGWSILGSAEAEGGAAIMLGDGVLETDDPGLGPLADNGGPTLTHALLPGSPAFNTGDPDVLDAPDTDQRGQARVQQGRLDIGAVEMAAALPATGMLPGPVLLLSALLALLGAALVAARRRARSMH